jgi:hypothetical protein
MQTSYQILEVHGKVTTGSVDWPEEPGYDLFRALLDPIIGRFEHVAVLHEGGRRDMFVNEMSAFDMPRNEAATRIYRNNTLTRSPETDPESIPAIHGPAVLFGRRVWF